MQPIVAVAAAGAIGVALGALIFSNRRARGPIESRIEALQRAAEIARSGTVNTVRHLQDRLRREGYSPAQIQGEAKRQFNGLIAAGAADLCVPLRAPSQ
jgi:hypothetical protein